MLLAPKGRHNVAQGASPGTRPTNILFCVSWGTRSQGLRPGLRYVAPSGLSTFSQLLWGRGDRRIHANTLHSLPPRPFGGEGPGGEGVSRIGCYRTLV